MRLISSRAMSAAALSVTSLAFMLSGLVRQKLAISLYGEDILAVVGQAALFQGLWLLVGGVAVLNSARIIASDGRFDEQERIQTASWLSRMPLTAALVMVPLSLLVAPFVSAFYTGTREWSIAFALASIGGFAQVALQNLISMTQILGERREFIRSSVATSIGCLLCMIALMSRGDVALVFSTFLMVPLTGLVILVTVSGTSRRVLTSRAKVNRTHLRKAARLSLATSITAAASLLVPSIISAEIGRELSLKSVALLQPALIVPTIASLVTASWTSVTMYHYNLSESRTSSVRRTGPWQDAVAIGLVVALFGLIALPLVPIGIRLLYDASLESSSSLVAVQLGAEVLTAVVWIAGSMLLPEGRLRLFVSLGVGGQLTKLIVASLLLPALGPLALPFGSLAQYLTQVPLLLLILRPKMSIWLQSRLVILFPVVAGMCWSWIYYPEFLWATWVGSIVLLAGAGCLWWRDPILGATRAH